MWVSHNEEICDLCRLNNILMVEKSRKIHGYMVLVKMRTIQWGKRRFWSG